MKRKSSILTVIGYLIIIIFTISAIFIGGRSYTVYVPNSYDSDILKCKIDNKGVVEQTDSYRHREYTAITFKAIKPGKSLVTATVYNPQNQAENTGVINEITVLPTGILYITGSNFGGFQYLMFGIDALVVYSLIVCINKLKRQMKTQFFSYITLLELALAIYLGLQSIVYSGIVGLYLVYPERIGGWQMYNLAGFSMSAIFLLSIPLIIIFAGFLSVSNLSLIRREGFGKNNLFGLLISFALFIGAVFCAITAIRNPNSTGIEASEIKYAALRVIISSAFVYFECLLLSAQICTRFAAKHEPKYNQDFILILGCKIRADGTPTPLLKGRIDRAIEFYHNQQKASDRKICFIPSGGQGSDEIMSEAECMKKYLIEHEIDESIIYPETNSTTTLENMVFSKKIAEEHKKNANILFATTNYHIFRSGIFSAKAGMRADGIGAKTKWYFWPNAQMREFIGLLASEWKINIAFIVLTVIFSTLFANITSIINMIV